LERLGYTVHTAETGQAALEAVQRHEPQAVVLDLGLPDMAGLDVLAKILDQNQTSRILVSSGTPFSNEILPEAQRQRVASLQKPYLPRTLIESVEDLIAGRFPQNSR
jgi:CheY-like chemotaxis protein